MTVLTERVYWNSSTYGNAIRLSRASLLGVLMVGCLVTPFTNWMIPFLPRWIRDDMVVRY